MDPKICYIFSGRVLIAYIGCGLANDVSAFPFPEDVSEMSNIFPKYEATTNLFGYIWIENKITLTEFTL